MLKKECTPHRIFKKKYDLEKKKHERCRASGGFALTPLDKVRAILPLMALRLG
jgi:hypothetical protein